MNLTQSNHSQANRRTQTYASPLSSPEATHPHPLIPTPTEIHLLLGSSPNHPCVGLIEQNLLHPVHEFLATGGKKLREEVIELGFLTAGGTLDEKHRKQLSICQHIIEGLHAGSMIIDDVQDGSLTRRNQPTLHERYGVAIAINAGNWLYFQAIHQIQGLGLKATQETHLTHYVNEIILKAHFGQALDVGTPILSIPQEGVKPTCLAAMELKTGALMSLAFDLGAFIADQRPLPSSLGVSLGQRFGVALQMFDDIGNFLLPPPKGKEDFINRRPSFLWAMAASEATPLEYSEFLQCVEALPDAQPLEEWVKHHHLIERAKTEASQSLRSILKDLRLTSDLENRINTLFQKLESAYV